MPSDKSGAFSPGSHRVQAQVRVICSAASSSGQGRVVRRHSGVGIAVCALVLLSLSASVLTRTVERHSK